MTERVSPQVQGQYSVIQEQPFDGKCSSFGPRGDAPRWNHRTIFDVGIVLARSGAFKDFRRQNEAFGHGVFVIADRAR